MSVNVRSGGEWVDSTPFRLEGAAWSNDQDAWYVYDGGAMEQFFPDGDNELLPPENVSVGTIGDHEATATWTNPTQTLTPTHYQVRIADITPVWTEFAYPETSYLRSNLDAATDYQFQIRNIVRADGGITHTSTTVSDFFTTSELHGAGRLGEDPDGTGSDSTIPWSAPSGGTGGAVGSGDCWWEYEWQTLDVTFASWPDLWIDSGITGSVAGDIGDMDFDPIADGLVCGTSVRLKFNENCNGTPAADEYGLAMVVPCTWDSACGGLPDNSSLDAAPYSDAVFAMPVFCYQSILDGGALVIEDARGESEYGELQGFGAAVVNTQKIYAAQDVTIDSAGVVGGRNTGVTAIAEGSDLAFSGSTRLQTLPTIKTKVLVVGQTVEVYAYPSGGGFKMAVTWPVVGGTSITLVDDTVRALGGWVLWAVSMDQDGTKELWVMGSQTDTDVTGDAVNMTAWNGDVISYGNKGCGLEKMAGWDRVLTANELGSLSATYDSTVLVDLAAMFFSPLNETTLESPPRWITYAEAITNQPFLETNPGYGTPWINAWTDEYAFMQWPTFAASVTDDAFQYLGDYWFDAYWTQATKPDYDTMVQTTLSGCMFFTAADELSTTVSSPAIGGTRRTEGLYYVHTITAGESFFTGLVTGSLTVDYIVVGGGGSGGGAVSASECGGGGGAGELIEITAGSLTASDYAFTPGAGAAKVQAAIGVTGSDSVFNGSTAKGGAGGGIPTVSSGAGGNGLQGAGGGGGGASEFVAGAGGTSATGYAGGLGQLGTGTAIRAGGGGSATEAGHAGSSDREGGIGQEFPSAAAVYFAGGGGGNLNYIYGGTSSSLGGGGGSGTDGVGDDGTFGTGGGGGGGRTGLWSGNGGSGVLVIRYLI